MPLKNLHTTLFDEKWDWLTANPILQKNKKNLFDMYQSNFVSSSTTLLLSHQRRKFDICAELFCPLSKKIAKHDVNYKSTICQNLSPQFLCIFVALFFQNAQQFWGSICMGSIGFHGTNQFWKSGSQTIINFWEKNGKKKALF